MKLLNKLFKRKNYGLVAYEFEFIAELITNKRYSEAKQYSKYLFDKYLAK